MSTWGDVAASRNQQSTDEYQNETRSIWDERSVDDYDDWQDQRRQDQDDARDSWSDLDDQDPYVDAKQAKQARRGPGSRGGTPAEFKHAQQRQEVLGRDTRGAKKKINQARHPIQTGGKAAKKKIKKSSLWGKVGPQSHSFHNPNGSR